MAAQYTEGSSSLFAGDYETLGSYDDALPIPVTSELQYIPTSDEIKYLNMQRNENQRIPMMIPTSYGTLGNGGKFKSVQSKDNGYQPAPNDATGINGRRLMSAGRARPIVQPIMSRKPMKGVGSMEPANYRALMR